MKAHFHGQLVCIWSSYEHIQYEVLQLCGLTVNKLQNYQLCHRTCHLWSLKQELQFLLASPE